MTVLYPMDLGQGQGLDQELDRHRLECNHGNNNVTYVQLVPHISILMSVFQMDMHMVYFFVQCILCMCNRNRRHQFLHIAMI